nr:alpha/beta hydrolase [Nocardia uniformis]
MSAGGPNDWSRWVDELLADSEVRRLIGHSIGSAVAVEAASRKPHRVDRLTLVAPFFLQPGPGVLARASLLTGFILRHAKAESLAARLTGDRTHAPTLTTSIADLRRPGTANRVGRLLSRSVDMRWRADLLDKRSPESQARDTIRN